jgi:NAD(P)H dehydrogenase (quinone)
MGCPAFPAMVPGRIGESDGYAKSGLQWGAYARSAGENLEQTGVSEESLGAARRHGVHVARAVAVLKGQTIFG